MNTTWEQKRDALWQRVRGALGRLDSNPRYLTTEDGDLIKLRTIDEGTSVLNVDKAILAGCLPPRPEDV